MIHFGYSKIRPKDWIRLFLNGVYSIAAQAIPKGIKKIDMTCVTMNESKTRVFQMPTHKECLNYLWFLIQEMKRVDAARHFPHEAALALQKENLPSKELPERLEEWLEEHLASNRPKISSQYGPVTFPEDTPIPDDPEHRLKQCFGLLFKTMGNPG